ncbi:SDR family oxidoreductase [Bacillus sp. BGMRC 2118]|nr:SDR family oxidoreductase [Bacillus sp. BGMRC 2118]
MNKTALITGSTSGLGFEFVKLFANQGYNLVIVARNKNKLIEIKDSYKNIQVTPIVKDLSLPGAAKEVYDEIENQNIKIDVLINNAGFGLLGNFSDLDIERQNEMIQLNVTALTELTYYVLGDMKKRNSGKILNVASTAAFQPGPFMAVYYATKAFVLSFSEALVEEVSDFNITVTTLCPGATKTNFGALAKVENTKMFKRAMNSETVAKMGVDALMKGKRVIITGGFNKFGALSAKFLPRSVAAKVAKYVAKETN